MFDGPASPRRPRARRADEQLLDVGEQRELVAHRGELPAEALGEVVGQRRLEERRELLARARVDVVAEQHAADLLARGLHRLRRRSSSGARVRAPRGRARRAARRPAQNSGSSGSGSLGEREARRRARRAPSPSGSITSSTLARGDLLARVRRSTSFTTPATGASKPISIFIASRQAERLRRPRRGRPAARASATTIAGVPARTWPAACQSEAVRVALDLDAQALASSMS